MLFLILSALLLNFSNSLAKNEQYMGYRVYNIKLSNQTQQDDFHNLKSDLIDFWRKPCVKYNVVGKAMVPPSHFDWFEDKLVEIKVERDVGIEDVFEYLNEIERKTTRSSRNSSNGFDLDGYYRYYEILDYLYELENNYTNSNTTFKVVQYGVSDENRPLVYLKLTNGNETDKPVVIIEAGMNPREWITIPSAINVVNNLLEVDQTRYLDDIMWIVIPVVNPDGYEYTHTNLRLWTKSRSLRSHLGFICPGVHLNRNFNIDWLVSDSSTSPCSHLYAGIEPFSEIETQFIRDLLKEYKPTFYISLQNSGKFITYPWRYEKAASGLFRRHYILGLDIIEDLEGYELDSGAIAFGDRESGTSTDYARRDGVFYTYNIGVEGGGDGGVIVPKEYIRTIAEDVWKAVAVAASGIEIN